MKTIAIVAEYNPLHLGHLKQIEYVKAVLKADNIITIMSGNFTQRGEIAIMNKYKRAKQAIIAGSDAVIELPTVFATSNAEVFSKGAIKIIEGLKCVDGICFGVESGSKDEYINLAKILNNESKEYKKAIKNSLKDGVSLAKAKFEGLKSLGIKFDEKLASTPNNILGLEYTKALLSMGSKIEIYPMVREGDHNDTTLKKGITSATSIRERLKTGRLNRLKKNLPPYVFKDLDEYPFLFDKLIMGEIIKAPLEKIASTPDCSEGLENRIKALSVDNKNVASLVEKVSTKRYTKTRVQRILLSTLLGIDKDFVNDALSSKSYAKVLAINSQNKDILNLLKRNSNIPILTRANDLKELDKISEKSYNLDITCSNLYSLISNEKSPTNQMEIV